MTPKVEPPKDTPAFADFEGALIPPKPDEVRNIEVGLATLVGQGTEHTPYDTKMLINFIKLQQEALLDQAIATELPWPKDVFGEVPSDDWSDIDDWLRENKGYAIDTVSATLMRRGWKCYLRELNKLRLEL